MSQTKAKRDLEQKIWAFLRLEGVVPSNTTKEGHTAYVQLKRDVQKQVAQNHPSFWQFLRDYEVTKKDVVNLLKSEIVFKDVADVQADFQRFRQRKKR